MNNNGFLCHSNVTEETMGALWRSSLALGLALSVPVAAYAAAPGHHHYRHAYRATAPAPPLTTAPGFGLWPPSGATSHSQYEVEGLSRDPDACVRYGCIGNN